MRVRLIRNLANPEPGTERRFINGLPGHHMALLMKLHQGAVAIAEAPENAAAYADVLQALVDLSGLHLVSWEQIDEAYRDLAGDGSYEVGVVTIEGEKALEKAKKAARRR